MRYAVLVLVGFFFTACGIFKSSPDRSRPSRPPAEKKPKTEQKTQVKKEDPSDDPDTVSLEIRIDTLEHTPEETTPDYRTKDIYSIQLLLPLVPLDEGGLIEETEPTDPEESEEKEEKLLPFNVHFLEYLSGFQMAMGEAVQRFPEFKYRLQIRSSGDFDALFGPTFDWETAPSPDVILGGVRPESVNYLTSISSQHNMYYISPWITSTPYSDNPLFLQLTPGLEQYCHFMADEVARDSTISAVTLLTSSEFVDRMDIFSSYFDSIYPDLDYQTWIIDRFNDEDKEAVPMLDRMISDTTHTVILAMDRDKSYLYEALAYFSNQELWEGQIYGFSSWRNYPLLFEYFEKGNIKLVSHTSPAKEDSLSIQFDQNYHELYGSLPTAWAKKGYDHGMFIAEGLAHYGLDFYAYLDQIQYHGIELFFEFPSQRNEQMEGLPLLPHINQGVKLLHYNDNVFRLKNE